MKKLVLSVVRFFQKPLPNIVAGSVAIYIALTVMYATSVNWLSFALGILVCLGINWIDYGTDRMLAQP